MLQQKPALFIALIIPETTIFAFLLTCAIGSNDPQINSVRKGMIFQKTATTQAF